MPYEIIILRPGFYKKTAAGEGSAWDTKFIISEILKHGLKPENINYVVGTHGHSDHIGNLNLFTQATHIVCHDISKDNVYFQHPFQEGVPYTIDGDVSIESTPGHTSQDVTVFVTSGDSNLGVVAVAGDIFENEHCLFDDDLWMGQSQFPELQKKSRNAILKRADTLVPGHGAMFQVPASYKRMEETKSTRDNIIRLAVTISW
ncbi:hypothetical protein EB796_019673 [Bugula neritina]|uniref:Metallo-beta-lactamase domain-containing protein 1 n=1 Tax=Bugula neritina TaxID=10212 RepID=A0A7J7J7T9_BUGNE|nr:hypothetical protein EB796_019673 [Bugula neritina]